jgi:hypothetical protein
MKIHPTPEAPHESFAAFMPGRVLALLIVAVIGLICFAAFDSHYVDDRFMDGFHGWVFVAIVGSGLAVIAGVLLVSYAIAMFGETRQCQNEPCLSG